MSASGVRREKAPRPLFFLRIRLAAKPTWPAAAAAERSELRGRRRRPPDRTRMAMEGAPPLPSVLQNLAIAVDDPVGR